MFHWNGFSIDELNKKNIKASVVGSSNRFKTCKRFLLLFKGQLYVDSLSLSEEEEENE
jgi:hypothetical protein